MASVRDEVEHGSPVPASGRVGATLQRARRGRGAELPRAAGDTRIPSVFLRALEKDAPIEEYPAPVYARYFLREYAQYLGLEVDPLVRAFDRQHELEAKPADPTLLPVEPRPRRWPAVAVTLLAIGAAAALFVVGQRPSEVEVPTAPPLAPATTSPAAGIVPTAPVSPAAPPLPAVEGVHVVLDVVGDCWIRATTDGDVAHSETVSSGRLVFRADEELLLELGSAGAVRLEVNGDPVETGALGTVERYRFEGRDGAHDTTLL
jgi:cytoskeletal protein RodZ